MCAYTFFEEGQWLCFVQSSFAPLSGPYFHEKKIDVPSDHSIRENPRHLRNMPVYFHTV